MQVVRRFKFDAAHHLPGYPGKCKNVHGHTWFVDIGVTGRVNSKTGFVVDFSILKSIMEPIIQCLDHHDLNTLLENPTAENLVEYIRARFNKEFLVSNELGLSLVRVWESPDSYAEGSNES